MANKISMVAASNDGDRIFCLYKNDSDVLARGFYDFVRDTFILTAFHSGKLKEGETVEDVINTLKKKLMEDYDWEFKNSNKVIKLIKNGTIKARRRRNNKKKKKR